MTRSRLVLGLQVRQTYISRGVDAIVLVPQDETALAPMLRAAKEKKIELVIVNSPVAGEAGGDFINFIGTDNYPVRVNFAHPLCCR